MWMGWRKKKTCLCSNEGSRREDIVLMIPWWLWEYVQVPRPLWTDECRLWLIISWYPAFKWLPHLDKTVTVVVLQMLCYMRNIILITKQQLVVCVFNFPELAWPRVFFFLLVFFCLCSIKAANDNVPQEGLLFGAFASKHSWGWCCHYVQLLGVAVICVILLECNGTPWGDKESADMREWAGQEFSLGKRKKTITSSQFGGVWWIPQQFFFLCSIPIQHNNEQKHNNEQFMRFKSWPHISRQCLRSPAPIKMG